VIVPAVCQGWLPESKWPALDLGARIRYVPDHGECHGKRKCYRVFCPDVLGDARPSLIAQSCLENEVRGVLGRVLSLVPKPTWGAVANLRKEADVLVRRLRKLAGVRHLSPWQRGQVYEKYGGSRRKRYAQAEESFVRGESLRKRDAEISAFVKAEKFWGAFKDPRIIQFRTVRYNLELGTFLKPVEKLLYRLSGCKSMGGLACMVGLPWVVKGLDSIGRAKVLQGKIGQFRHPVIVSLDASRFDKHVSEKVLEVEHGIYLALFGNDPLLRRLLQWQIVNKGRTMHGLKYSCRGKRMSGDMNTALGNCLVSLLLVLAVFRELGISKFQIHDDGDDCLIIVESDVWERHARCFTGSCVHVEHCRQAISESDLAWLGASASSGTASDFSLESLRKRGVTATTGPGIFGQYGFVMKVENVATELYQVVHCQTRPTFLLNKQPSADEASSGGSCGVLSMRGGNRVVMMRDFRKILKTSLTAFRHFNEPMGGRKVMRAIGYCELVLGRGCPVIQEFALMLLRVTEGFGLPKLFPDEGTATRILRELGYGGMISSDRLVRTVVGVRTEDITPATRAMFALTWGLSADAQLQIESQLRSMTWSMFNGLAFREEPSDVIGSSTGCVELGLPRSGLLDVDYPDLPDGWIW